MKVYQFEVGDMQNFTYILEDEETHDAIVIDPSWDLQDVLQIIEKNNPKLKQLHVTFSNGGYIFKEALSRLSPEHQDTIIVITAGSAFIIDDNLTHRVYNVIGDKDLGSIRCNGGEGGIEASKQAATIHFIHQNETAPIVGGHYFKQPDYQDKISIILKDEILNDYEVY